MSSKHDPFSGRARAKLKASGVPVRSARKAGLYSVESAKHDVHEEFADRPALVFPYFDVAGEPIAFRRDGEVLEFVRVRYLDEPRTGSFVKRKSQRYAQLRGSGVFAYFPRLFNWTEIARDTSWPVVITEGELKALKGCCAGFATLGLAGVDNFRCRLGEAIV